MSNDVGTTPGVTPAGAPPSLGSIAKLINQYVRLRDRKREIEAAHKKVVAQFTDVMGTLGTQLLEHMNQTGVDSLSSSAGTIYRLTRLSATLKDPSAFREWIATNNEFGLVDWRANAPAVFDYIKEHDGQAPPGVNASSYVTVGVRRPNEEET